MRYFLFHSKSLNVCITHVCITYSLTQLSTTLQVLSSHMWLVVTILDSTDRKFFRTTLVLPESIGSIQNKEPTKDWSNDGRLPVGGGNGAM